MLCLATINNSPSCSSLSADLKSSAISIDLISLFPVITALLFFHLSLSGYGYDLSNRFFTLYFAEPALIIKHDF